MFPSDRFCSASIFFLIFCLLTTAQPLYAAMESRFELDSKTLGIAEAAKKQITAGKASSRRTRKGRTSATGVANGSVHIVKSGDNLFKILMRDYGFSNDEAETFIEVICRENNITNIRRLKVGQKVFIPSSGHSAERMGKNIQPLRTNATLPGTMGMSLRLAPPDLALSERVASIQIRKTWDKIVPPLAAQHKPAIVTSPKYSLTLDPQRYPVFAAMGGGRILVDATDSIPPLVKALIVDKDPSIRIVSESPVNGKRFLLAMLDSAGFYSVEEDFSMDFGSDPKLTVYSDFKIEKSPESVINLDVILMNSGLTSNPRVLNEFLKKEGFTVHEPFASSRPATAPGGKLFQITSRNQTEIADSLLAFLAITPERDKSLDVFAADNNGISLSVKVERYFEKNGQRHIIVRFDGDPVTYTLYRILEAKGYQTVILEGQDDFRKVTEKLLSSMSIQGTYDRHIFGQNTGQNYSFQMSGFRLEGPGLQAADLFLTNLEFDRVIGDLLLESGYRIISR